MGRKLVRKGLRIYGKAGNPPGLRTRNVQTVWPLSRGVGMDVLRSTGCEAVVDSCGVFLVSVRHISFLYQIISFFGRATGPEAKSFPSSREGGQFRISVIMLSKQVLFALCLYELSSYEPSSQHYELSSYFYVSYFCDIFFNLVGTSNPYLHRPFRPHIKKLCKYYPYLHEVSKYYTYRRI